MGTVAHAKSVHRTKDLELKSKPAAVELRARIRVGDKGRIIIPAALREALGMTDGEAINLRVVEGELRLETLRSRIRRVQERARQYVKPGTLVSEELSVERRAAAKHE